MAASSSSSSSSSQRRVPELHEEICMASTSSAGAGGPRPSVTLISTRTGRRTSIHHDTEFADRMNSYIVSPLIPLPKPPRPSHRRVCRRRNPTLDRLLQPPGPQGDPTLTQQLLEKLRSLKLRLQRHAAHSRWPPRDLILMEGNTSRRDSRHSNRIATTGGLQDHPADESDGIVCTESDIRAIVSDLLQQGESGSGHRQLIGVVPLPDSPTRRLVCFIDPRRNQLAPTADGSQQVRGPQLCDSCRRPMPLSQQQQLQQPRDVMYDDNGQTWEVYGADIDPDLLGRAIQTHLAAIRAGGSR